MEIKLFKMLTIVMITMAATSSLATAAALPKTGQIKCYNDAGTEITCTGTGQDGASQAGVAIPSPRFVNNNNGTITDTLTNLTWLRNANCWGAMTWLAALTKANALASSQCTLTDGSTAGTWRMPNRKELASLVSYAVADNATALINAGFLNVQTSTAYWSSSTESNNTAFAWAVNFASSADTLAPAIVDAGKTTESLSIWPVKGGM